MKKYINPENQRYVYYVRESINGYSLQVLIVDRDENVPLTQTVASQLSVTLPTHYRIQSTTRQVAEKLLGELAALNGWVVMQ